MSIIDLQETSPNIWKAKYQGNYGIYTIKIKTKGTETIDFSCSCPSDYYPCKHIAMIEKAIKQRIADSKKSVNNQEITVEQLLKSLSQKELYDFIVRQAQYNPELKNTILLEFTHKINKKDTNYYSQIIRNALAPVRFYFENIEYDEDCFEIDVIDQWLDKAQNFADQNNPGEAILICKACIEEYASWYKKQDSDIIDYVDTSYEERPFNILNQILSIKETDCRELLNYCKLEMLKSKYEETEMYDRFCELFMKLSAMVGSNDFIEMQDKLLQHIKDKNSWEAQKILQQKIDFYRNNGQPEKVWDVIEENLQIESFRRELTIKLIAENKLQEAKNLINTFISEKENKNRSLSNWYELKLQIAQKEKDIPTIRNTSYQFIATCFYPEYYKIYKSTFGKEEWPNEMEKLIQCYEKNSGNNRFSVSVADILLAEKQEKRLGEYIEKHLSIDNLEKYYNGFSSSFPEKTIALFRQITDKYAHNNTGRESYEHILSLLKKMNEIEGGNKLVKEMISQYRIIYRNRKVMMEILNRYSF